MKEPVLLTRFEYAILSSAITVKIDFEHGNFYLEGSQHSILFSSKARKIRELVGQEERVKVESSLFPGSVIDLSDQRNDGLFFTMDGSIMYAGMMKTCTGLMLLENIRDGQGGLTRHWMISFNLHIIAGKEYDLKLRLPIFTGDVMEGWN